MEIGILEDQQITYNSKNLDFSKISDISEIISNSVFSKENRYMPELKDIVFHYFVFKYTTNINLPENDDFDCIFKIINSEFGRIFKESVSEDFIYKSLYEAVNKKIEYKKKLYINQRNDVLSEFITKLTGFTDDLHKMIKKYDEKYGNVLSKGTLRKLFKKISNLDEKGLVQAILQIQESGDVLTNLAKEEST